MRDSTKNWLKKFILPPLCIFSALYIAEFYLEFRDLPRQSEVLRLRSAGKNAYPAFTAQVFLEEPAKESLLPLGGIANVSTVLCQEDGPIVSYVSDRYGFRNPDSLWDSKQWDVVVVGDSYAQGYCVADGKSFTDQIRRAYPLTANLGSFGNGPLANLASIIEYATQYKPKYVVWVYVPNDLMIDLPLEHKSPVLKGYLRGQSQNLVARQQEIDELLKQKSFAHSVQKRNRKISDLLALKQLNRLWNQASLRRSRAAPSDFGYPPDYLNRGGDFRLFEAALERAKEQVVGWGGKLILATVRDAYSFNPEMKENVDQHWLRLAITASALKIPMVEFGPEGKNPYEYFNALDKYYGHINEKGHELFAKQILKTIDRVNLR
jgi:hypothetical protein